MSQEIFETPCGHNFNKIVKNGWRHNGTGDIQKYKCIQCNKKFSFGPLKKKFLTKGLLEFCLAEHRQGVSSRSIEKKVLKKFKLKISHCSILNWLKVDPDYYKPSPFQLKIIEFEKEKIKVKLRKLIDKRDEINNKRDKLTRKIKQTNELLKKVNKEIINQKRLVKKNES